MSKQNTSRGFDLEVSASLISERLVGEILGWDLVDWSVIEPHRGRKFSFGRQREGDPSIHDQLKPLYHRCDPGKDDFSALKPSPIINTNLSKLVGHLCRHIGKHELATSDMDSPALERTVEQDHLHLAVIERLLDQIDNSPELRERAKRVKRIAAAAENELEKHFADLINERLESSFLPGGIPDQHRIDGLHDLAKCRLEEMRLLNERELAGLAAPALALDDEALIRIEMVKILLNRFPYVRNYELMMFAELAMLQQPLVPRFARERMLSGKAGTIDETAIVRLDKAIANLPLFEKDEARSWLGPLAERSIAVCGSGALPLSALFLHLFTGSTLILVDEDRSAVERSRRLIGNLERLSLLEPGALSVRRANAGDIIFSDPGKQLEKTVNASVACDAVMVASLVDLEAKASIVRHFGGDLSAPELLILRSATGLSAVLAYDPVPTDALSRSGLAFCGETVPATQVTTHLDRAEAARRNVVCATSPDVLAIAHPDVVNTTEIYKRVSNRNDAGDFDFDACATVEDWIRNLEAISKSYPSPDHII